VTSPREYAGRKTFNSRCGRKPRPSHRKTSIRLWLVCSHSGATGVIAPKLLWAWRWRFFWLFLLPTFRLALPLSVIGCRGRATLLLALRLLVLLWRRRLSVSALHFFSLGARFTGGSSTGNRRDRLPKSGCRTGSTLLMFSCAQRWRRAEPLTLKSSLVTLRRNLSCPTTRGIWLLTWSSHWLATMFLLLRRGTPES